MRDLYLGDARDGLRQFIADGVRAQTCVTSPPYWGLRDYGTVQWDGGASDCDHLAPARGGVSPATSSKQLTNAGTLTYQFTGDCGKCGARRIDQQLGLEPAIAEYIANMVDVFRLVRNVLADDGTLWLNIGDSYATGTATSSKPSPHVDNGYWQNADKLGRSSIDGASSGLKVKDLCGQPWRLAFALQADGWYLRSDIIWHKPNPMPESVTDRPTKAHEYLFLLAKSERYFYDGDSIRELHQDRNGIARFVNGCGIGQRGDTSGWHGGEVSLDKHRYYNPLGRNCRTVWTIATEAFPDAHFATFPTALVEPCILAGSRVGDLVLDPFMGSGTVAQVAQDLGRRWIGCELNPDYAKMIRQRTAQQGLQLQAAD